MKSFFAAKFKSALISLATISSRFSLGVVLAVVPLLIAHYFGNDTAKTVALAINLSSYSSWLALGGYSAVMRDFRLAKNNDDKGKLKAVYQHLAILQSIGAIFLTALIAFIYISIASPDYLVNSKNTFLLGLFFGVTIQCSSFWINIALGTSYSKNEFINVGLNVSALRLALVIVIIIGSYISNIINDILIAASIILILGCILLFWNYTSSISVVNQKNNSHSLKKLLIESIIYFKWSMLSTLVFLFPVTAISSIQPDLLLSATIGFFLAGANQNLVAALITPRANTLLDGIGDLRVLKAYISYTVKIIIFVTISMLISVWLIDMFIDLFSTTKQRNFSLSFSFILICASGFRSLTLANTQAAVALKKEKIVMISPILEATVSLFGVTICWLTNKGEWIIGVFVVAVIARIFMANYIETNKISAYWKKNY